MLLGQQLVEKLSSQGQVLTGTHLPSRGMPGARAKSLVFLTSGSPNTVPTVSKMCPSGGGLLMFPAGDIPKTKALKSGLL